ncbi:hypothetical protein DL96DRAFT_1474693 [Flagelloscypha sp. PMI_526]|nr:hypothetical protein DL96DRAFT_1474693 [Flagelloscypha sp. PMI_526]
MTSSSTHASKRRRTDSPAPDPSHAPVVVRRGTPWFEDGNLVLQSRDKIQFKVYKGLLARHSAVFKDMVSIPQPQHQKEMAEGCPLVFLTDSGADLSTFLCLLSSWYLVFFNCSFFPILTKLRVMLQLGKKYQVSSLKNGAIARLRAGFPDTIKEFDESSAWCSIDQDTCEMHEVAQLAFEEGIQIVLPSLLYSATSIDHAPAVLLDDLYSPDFKIMLMAGLLRAFKQQSKMTFTWLRSDHIDKVPKCRQAASCLQVLRNLAMAHFGWAHQIEERALEFLPKLTFWPPPNLCNDCKISIEKRHEAERREFWEALPSFFDLPPWEKLREAAAKL